MGLLLLVGSLGSIISLPLAGRVVGRFGARTTVAVSTGLIIMGLGGVAGSVAVSHPIATGVGLLMALAGVGAMDVAMNYEGSLTERRLGQSIMPHFHGGFSLGTIMGAGAGTLANRAGVSMTTHIGIALGVVAVMIIASLRYSSPVRPAASEQAGSRPGYGRAWVEPRTLGVGFIVLAAGLTEGAANDWLALVVREGFDVEEHLGPFGLTLLVTAMTVMRFSGPALLNRFGRVVVLRFSVGMAIVGLLVFGLSPNLPVALVGSVLWGFGAGLGFPVGMSAASDDPLHAAARISVVSSIGYGAFLSGPLMIGGVAELGGYRHELLALVVVLSASLMVMTQAAPPARAE